MKFLKKPIEIEAIKYQAELGNNRIINWLAQQEANVKDWLFFYGEIIMPTLEGKMKVLDGDWIIKGVSGEFYPCKPDIFEKTYLEGEIGEISDGYHTFNELYDHRITLFIALCRIFWEREEFFGCVWRSKLHSDGSKLDGWFILGIKKEKGDQITYHLPLDRWDETEFAQDLEKAPEFDGHSATDVLERLKHL